VDVTKQEPRLKGSFKQIQIIYREMFFVLHQMFDRFDSIRFMRQQYGSAVLTELSQHVYLYRRDVYAAMINLMRAVENALETKKPLPQFLPSARILHLRLVNKVRMVLIGDDRPSDDSSDEEEFTALENKKHALTASRRHRMLLKKYMGWSATSSALEEVIEYLEELVNLTKLLVGYNQFKYGFLSKPIHETWAEAALSMDWSCTDEGYQANNGNNQYYDKATHSLITTPIGMFARTREEQEAMDELPRLENQATLELSKMFQQKNTNNSLIPYLSSTSHIAPQNVSSTHRPQKSGNRHFYLPHLLFNLFSKDSKEATHLTTSSEPLPHPHHSVQTPTAHNARPAASKEEELEKPQDQSLEREKTQVGDDDEADQIDELPATMKRVISRRYSISSTHSHHLFKKRN
jgi:hypothetical protein